MILTNSLMVSLVLLGVGMLLWGIWIATFRSATTGTKWRFEFYCFDFGFGALIASLITALTLGTLGWDGFAFIDELGLSGKRQELWAFLGGMTFALGNMLMLGATSISGVVLSVPITAGLGFALGGILMNLVNPGGSWLTLNAGVVATLAALVFGFLAQRSAAGARLETAIREGRTKSTKKVVSLKGILLAVFGGLFIAGYFPLMDLARVPDLGMGPYTATFLCSLGIFFATIVFNLFFMNLPVQGNPAEIGGFFRGAARYHVLGFVGGALWSLGMVAHYVALRSEGAALPLPVYQYLALGIPGLIAGLLGLMAWKELAGDEGKVRTFGAAMIILLAIGVALTSMSPAALK